MTRISRFGVIVLGLAVFALDVAIAQESSDEAAVWTVVEQQWERQQRRDKRWIDELLVEEFMAWPNDSPAPRNKPSTRMWNDFSSDQVKILEHELYPLSIVVHGDMAVAHYLYTQATANDDDEVSVSNGRYTDVLVRVDGQWRFISWHGGDDD
jgi:ketosteroid isomerase-like protein